ncbi:MAG TPA: serine hydrolase [Alphaproteobacteria bacterium]|nr:serine hydrolase [Alphaproteobacteria bacterium]
MRQTLSARFAAVALLLILSPGVAQAAQCEAPPASDDGWAVAAPGDVGIDPDRLCALVPRFEAWTEADIHGVLVVRHGKLVFEHYFRGADELWGMPLGNVAHASDLRHDARSVTKSVTALVLGIALGRGMIKGDLDTPVFDLLPAYADLRTPEKALITLRHLLTMSAGLEWDEDIPYSDARNSETRMDFAPDPVRFVLSQPVAAPAGEVYNYSGGSATLVAAILKQATGQPLDVLAHDLLFSPLGITDVEWVRGRGEPFAASGLRLRPRDFAKLGQLVLAHGVWQGNQVVPAEFIAQATAPQINGRGLYFYGFQFWLGRSFVKGREIDWSAAVGLGGQRIFIVPALDLVAVVNAGLYRSELQSWVPRVLLNRYVLEATDAAR